MLHLQLGDLVERQLDGGLALEERHEHRELAALGLDLADGAGQARERALLDRDGLADLVVHLRRDRARGRRRALRGARLRRGDTRIKLVTTLIRLNIFTLGM